MDARLRALGASAPVRRASIALRRHVLDEDANACSCRRWELFELPFDERIEAFVLHQALALASAGLLGEETQG
jgi:hypothetical protein